jgi:hypothetical protein
LVGSVLGAARGAKVVVCGAELGNAGNGPAVLSLPDAAGAEDDVPAG